MNETLKKAVAGFVALNKATLTQCEEVENWADDNDLDVSEYSNLSALESFFKMAVNVGKDDKYATSEFVIRNCPDVNPSSYFISLFRHFGIKRVIVTVEAKSSFIVSLMAIGYKAESVRLTLTDKWGKDKYWAEKNKAQYGYGVLLTID